METPNPFASARVVSVNTDPAVYLRSGGSRGEKDFIMSRGELMNFATCPHRWVRGYEAPDSKATEWGSLMDTLLLSHDAFADRVAIYPAEYPADGKKGEILMKPWNNNATFAKEWKKAQGEKLFIKADENNDAHIALAVLRSDAVIAEIVDTAQKQVFVMAEYHNKVTDLVIPVKALIDIVPTLADFERCLIDFKTCASAAMRLWIIAVFTRNYDVQGALYLDAYTKATGEDRIDFRHICSESVSPYEVAKRLLSSEFIEMGRARYVRALKRYARCLADNHWPGYDADSQDLALNGFTITNPLSWMMSENNETAYDSWAGAEIPDEPEPKKLTEDVPA